VGLHNNDLLYLDPHYVQKSVPSHHVTNDGLFIKHLNSYHCNNIKKLSIEKMCTSIAFGFYIQDEDAYLQFKVAMQSLAKLEDSIFSVMD